MSKKIYTILILVASVLMLCAAARQLWPRIRPDRAETIPAQQAPEAEARAGETDGTANQTGNLATESPAAQDGRQ